MGTLFSLNVSIDFNMNSFLEGDFSSTTVTLVKNSTSLLAVLPQCSFQSLSQRSSSKNKATNSEPIGVVKLTDRNSVDTSES